MSASVELTYCPPTIYQGMTSSVAVEGWTTGKTVDITVYRPEDQTSPEDAIAAYDLEQVDGVVPLPSPPPESPTVPAYTRFTMFGTRKDDQTATISYGSPGGPLIMYTKETSGMTTSFGAPYIVNKPEIYFSGKELSPGSFSYPIAAGDTIPFCGINLSRDSFTTPRAFLKSQDTGEITEIYVRTTDTGGMTIVEQYRDRFALVTFAPLSGDGVIEPGAYDLYIVMEYGSFAPSSAPTVYSKYGVCKYNTGDGTLYICGESYEMAETVAEISTSNVMRQSYVGGMSPLNSGRENSCALLAAILNAYEVAFAAVPAWAESDEPCKSVPYSTVNIPPGTYRIDRRIPVPTFVKLQSMQGEAKLIVDNRYSDFEYQAYDSSFGYTVPESLESFVTAEEGTGPDAIIRLAVGAKLEGIAVECGNGSIFPRSKFPKYLIAADDQVGDDDGGANEIKNVKLWDYRYQDVSDGHESDSACILLGNGNGRSIFSNIDIHTCTAGIAYDYNSLVSECFFDRVRVHGGSSARGQFGRCVGAKMLFYRCEWENIERGPIGQGGGVPKLLNFFVECSAKNCGQNYEGAESTLFETSFAQYLEPVIATSANTITVPTPSSPNFIRPFNFVWITSGTGRGQGRLIINSVDNEDGTFTITFSENWRIQPDATSIITASPALLRMNMLGCRATSQRMLAAIFEPSAECVFVGNKTRDCDLGVYFYGQDRGKKNNSGVLIRIGAEVHIGLLLANNDWVNTPRAVLFWISRQAEDESSSESSEFTGGMEPLFLYNNLYSNRFANSGFTVSHNKDTDPVLTIVGLNFSRDSWDVGLDMTNEVLANSSNPFMQYTVMPRTLSILPVSLLEDAFLSVGITGDSVVNGYSKTTYGNGEPFWGPETSGVPNGFPIPGLASTDPQVAPGHLA